MKLVEKLETRIPQRFPNVLVDAAESDAQLFKYTWHSVVFPFVGRGFSRIIINGCPLDA